MIGDGETPNVAPMSSKQALRAMLANVVANTPGAIPIKNIPEGEVARDAAPRAALGCNSIDPDRPPSSHQIAVAIVAAARELGADPIAVATGVTTMGGRLADHSVSRARGYAASAIKEVFPHNGSTAIGRWVGATNPLAFLSTLTAQRRAGKLRWWDDRLYKRVVLRLRTTPREMETK